MFIACFYFKIDVYLSPTWYIPDARGILPIDFNEEVAVNPIDSCFLKAFSAAFARSNVLNGEIATAEADHGTGLFILFNTEKITKEL